MLTIRDDEVQAITFRGNPRGSFFLSWDDDKDPTTPPATSNAIAYNGNTVATPIWPWYSNAWYS
jgi:hypothetical protein